MDDCTIYIVDDDSSVLNSIQTALVPIEIPVRAFRSAEEFIQNFDPIRACLILDLKMPGMTGLELFEWLRVRNIDIPVIILSGHADVPAVVNGMKLGAVDFLEKPINDQALIEKVRELVQSEKTRCAERAKIQVMRDNFATLTEREKELIELLAQGMSSKQISTALRISIKTVENHRSHLLAKTGAVNVASLIRMKMMAVDRSAVA